MALGRFIGKVAAITGAGAGIGAATARRIAAEGGKVALLDFAEADVRRVAGGIEVGGGECLTLAGDIADPETSARLIAAAVERWEHVDVLVANAAVRQFGPLGSSTAADWDRVLAVNLLGTTESCLAAARQMRLGRRGGSVVLVSSTYALVGRCDMPIYDASKAALLSLTRSLAVELAGDNIRVNSICPGFTITEFHLRRAAEHGRTEAELRAVEHHGLLRRPAEPDEIAAAIAFLASDDASYITASNLMVDAGRHVL